jgi:hypothetical protein
MSAYDDYYLHQVGSGLSVFAGARRQSGHGFLNTILRMAAPLMRRGAKAVGNKLLNAGLNVMSDVASGRPVSVKRRMKEQWEAEPAQKAKTPRKKAIRRRTATRTRRDIFSK